MSKYRKKPIVIDAFKWTGEDEHRVFPDWFMNEINVGDEMDGRLRIVTRDVSPEVRITTPQGIMFAVIGDYIIQDETGDIYSRSSAIFEATYEKVDG